MQPPSPRSPSPPPAPEEIGVTPKKRKFTDNQEKELGEWLLGMPMLYDKGSKAYRDTRKKDAAIHEKCMEMGIERGEYTMWYHYMRSAYGRLTRKASGSGSREFTDREKWIISTFSFFKSHIVRHESRQLGVSI